MRVFDLEKKIENFNKSFELNNGCYWILLNVTELDMLNKYVLLDGKNIVECRDFDQSSRIEYYNEYIFLLLNILEYHNESVYSRELNLFLGRNYLITVYKDDLDVINEMIEDVSNSKNCNLLNDKPEPSVLLYYILDRIIVKNYNIISILEAEADKIEIRILKNPKGERAQEIINIRRQVYKVRKFLNPLRYIGDSLICNDNRIIEDESIVYFIGLNRKIDKLMMSLDGLVQDLGLVREAFEAEISNKTNELMKVFTLIATIFLPLNLLTSMYGMNVKHIPLASIEYGYFYIISFMALVTIMLIYFFKRKKWL